MLLRFILVLVILIGGVLFTLQNLTPVLSLVFLGIQTPSFPLSWWVLGAIAAGSATTLTISVLFGLSNFIARPSARSQPRASTQGFGFPFRSSSSSRYNQPDQDDAVWKNWSGYEKPDRTPEQSSDRTSSAPNSENDWEEEFNEDWGDEQLRDTVRDSRTRTDFEVPQAPKRESRSGSVYSYGYRDPGNSGVGNSEKVVDAEYRVLVPPHRPLDEDIPLEDAPPPAQENADDWFEDSSDTFEDGSETRDRSPRP